MYVKENIVMNTSTYTYIYQVSLFLTAECVDKIKEIDSNKHCNNHLSVTDHLPPVTLSDWYRLQRSDGRRRPSAAPFMSPASPRRPRRRRPASNGHGRRGTDCITRVPVRTSAE